jgi:hypothetical protein
MSLIIPTLGLLVAAGFILITLFSIIFSNPIHTEIELQTLADAFTTRLQTIDTCMIETKAYYHFPTETRTLLISLSPQSLSIVKNDTKDPVIFNQLLLVNPWIRTPNDPWMNAEEFHHYLFLTVGSNATQTDPIPYTEEFQTMLHDEWNQSFIKYLHNPYKIHSSDPIGMEKCILYLDKNNNGIWEKTDGKQEFVLTYQE